ncbi:hypothetical protein WICPIJ_000346 [Wickerhamomyces pijperi]|uniref:Uncharacterized protein n=1 Tax=Wickerhamomyces pijperi TaxID=599730 RepID=A0A9P8TS16_WICPI|nr:hypothetical protein WICPIJ_000346 [Wickerhamomyces pijperi]
MRSNRVVESLGLNRIPSSHDHDIGKNDLIFESSTKVTLWLRQGTLNFTSDTRDGFDLSTFKLGNFQSGGKHVLDESGVSENLVWMTNQLQLLDNLNGGIHFFNNTSGGDSESTGGLFGRNNLHTTERRVWSDKRTIEGSITESMLRGVLQHSCSCSGVRSGVNWQSLETSPTQGQDQRIVGLQDLLVPSMSSDSDVHEPESFF